MMTRRIEQNIAIARYIAWAISLLALVAGSPAWAHDPIFGNGPHVLFKGGVELAAEVEGEEAGEENDAGVERGDKILFDLVGGFRPTLTSYLEPDTVWLLELNGEYGHKAELDGATIDNTGGTEWFLSPGIFWTSAVIWGIGFFAAFLALPLRIWLGF